MNADGALEARQQALLAQHLGRSAVDVGFDNVFQLLRAMEEVARNRGDDSRRRLNALSEMIQSIYSTSIAPRTESWYMIVSMNILQQEVVDYMGLKAQENPGAVVAVPFFYTIGVLSFAVEANSKNLALTAVHLLSDFAENNLRQKHPGILHENFKSVSDCVNWGAVKNVEFHGGFERNLAAVLEIKTAIINETVEYLIRHMRTYDRYPERLVFLKRYAVMLTFHRNWVPIDALIISALLEMARRLPGVPVGFWIEMQKDMQMEMLFSRPQLQ